MHTTLRLLPDHARVEFILVSICGFLSQPLELVSLDVMRARSLNIVFVFL